MVQLVGFCNNDWWFRRGKGLYICSEYISNGALDKKIFGTSTSFFFEHVYVSFLLCWSCSSYILHAHFGSYTIQSNLYIRVVFMCILCCLLNCVYVYWSASLGQSVIEWPIRYQIICGICAGLKHLHQDRNSKILHMDLKPSNILLDEEMKPKIADFGLSRAFLNSRTHTYTDIVKGSL